MGFFLREGEFLPLAAGDDGIVRSEMFPGLWLDVRAMLEGKLDVVLAVLQKGISAPEHAKFVDHLSRRTP
jgi:hypothetical protein